MRLNKVNNSNNNNNNFNIANSLINVGDNKSSLTYVNLDDLIEAPKEWNFYGQLNHTKMMELIESIKEVGLQNAIVVWETDDNKYMILSGHNRSYAYKILRDTENYEKFKTIPAIIKKKNELTDERAEQIIIDTNWVQRELTPIQKSKSIIKKYYSLRQLNGSRNGNLNKIIAEEYNISEKSLITYKSLVDLIPEFQDLIETGKLPIKTGMMLSKFDEGVQDFLYHNYDYKIIVKKQTKLQKYSTKEMLIKVLDEDDEKVEIKIDIKSDLKEDFLKELEELKNKYLFKYKVKK